ncbi:hypothetical protein SPRG_07762 [Saprolegnia parasitica CBS 223.65]|uniref:MATE efflux family protein n=1 Tax=Saprolegnia parasitica (strain CBS 223.65) TaxID=695850 RepID=A0A067CKG2_SAPPC|nr:hypothetical protein SPRG_07762 [Saprolegnia parasitica CBS 223.65]KDO27051.1 hypothetical protein SPRG_07762 [Saprolegnia parasitica CBS 223.65]|eukprot:XP_012202146.1 hypothetical protein SPRG_07762 [Saprolegnia parasitica CBS 223.65]
MARSETAPLMAPSTPKDEFRHLLLLALPLIVSQVLEYLPNVVNGMLTGHLETTNASEARLLLSANGLSGLYFTVFIYSAAIGVGTALDGLCAQAYGKGAIDEIGVLLQTACITSSALVLPLLALCVFSSPVLLALGQPLDVALATQACTRLMALAIPFVFGYEILKRVLQGQNAVRPIVFAFLGANAVNGVVSYAFLYHTSMGYTGCALAFPCMYAAGGALLYPKVAQLQHLQASTWCWHSAWQRMPLFLLRSFSGWAMFVFELAGVSTSSFLAGGLPNATAAITATSIYMGFRMIFSMVYLGLGVAVSIRVGNALGAHQPQRAKTAAWQTLCMSVSWAILSGLAMVLVGGYYAELYTHDSAVLSLVKELLRATAPLQGTMAIWGVVQGVFRGSGTPHEGAALNLIGFFLLGLPLGYAMAFHGGFGVLGLWLGVYTGFGVCAAYGLYWLITVQWENLMAKVDDTLGV